jgi:hypothetical protein
MKDALGVGPPSPRQGKAGPGARAAQGGVSKGTGEVNPGKPTHPPGVRADPPLRPCGESSAQLTILRWDATAGGSVDPPPAPRGSESHPGFRGEDALHGGAGRGLIQANLGNDDGYEIDPGDTELSVETAADCPS